jgi:hypothetical protein
MRGSGNWLVKPREQIKIVLPGIVALGVSVIVGYAVASALRYAAVDALARQNVDERVLESFVHDTAVFMWIFWGVSAVVFVGAFVWAWWISIRVFGPVARLEKAVGSVLRGDQKFLDVKTRKSDMLHPLFELFGQLLSRPRS